MPYMQDTVLGRRIRIGDWRSFHRDRILHVLYQMRDTSAEAPTLTWEQIRSITGLDKHLDISSLVREMVTMKPKLLMFTSNQQQEVTITQRGVRWVEESPRPR